jgi:tripartite-type tricarboxylate transporter receptor subunit TctC
MKRLLVALLRPHPLANAQTFPGSKPIAIVVPFAAGGPTDLVARQLGEAMRKAMGGSANFVVENTAGAGGTIGATKVARAAPDGHTLLLFHIGMAATPACTRRSATSRWRISSSWAWSTKCR